MPYDCYGAVGAIDVATTAHTDVQYVARVSSGRLDVPAVMSHSKLTGPPCSLARRYCTSASNEKIDLVRLPTGDGWQRNCVTVRREWSLVVTRDHPTTEGGSDAKCEAD